MGFFKKDEKLTKLELLIKRLANRYLKNQDELVDVLSKFIEKSELEYFNSRTFANEKMTIEFKEELDKSRTLEFSNRALERNIKKHKSQNKSEFDKGQKLREKLNEVKLEIQSLRNENEEISKELNRESKKRDIIKFKNQNNKISKLQKDNIDYKKHQMFLAIVTVVGIIAAILLFYFKK
jgi:predicted RND superfamily exporter protein